MKRLIVFFAVVNFFTLDLFSKATLCKSQNGHVVCFEYTEVMRNGVWYDACCCHFSSSSYIGCQDDCGDNDDGC